MSDSKPSISFSFSSNRKAENVKLAPSKLLDGAQDSRKEETDFISAVEDKKLNGSVQKAEKKDLVIPLITKNRWRVPAEKKELEIKSEKNTDLDDLAAKEIIEETLKASDNWENRGAKGVPSNLEIPLFMQNRVPSGFETDEKVDVSLRADQSSLDDYEAIPVEAYGLAMLRGMGWKASEGIGLSRKGVAAPVEVKLRPKGLGLGADSSVLKNANKALGNVRKGDEDLKVVVGAHVQVLCGKQQNSYGQIVSIDANTGRALVKMAVGNNEVEVSELFLKPVSAKEYKDSARILNKDKYEEYKSRQEKQRQEEEDKKERDRRNKKRRSPEKREKKEKKSKKSSDVRVEQWLYPSLRVRCIDSRFKDGQYYKQKMIVIDVISSSHCICKTESGKLLDKVSISKLETVIPRNDPAYVMVVRGKRKGQVCEVIERDKERCMATIQILPDRDEVFEIDYDSICEYTGDV